MATRVLPPVVLAILVALTAAIPMLSNRWFYYWDDSAAAFTPGWRVIGERLLSGSWPTMIPELWAGGNITAEALYGTYNPLLLANSALIASIPNLAIGITVVKMQFMAILAVGIYVLAKQYGANTSMAFVAGFAMPFAGYTLYFDASSWASGLFAFAWIPHVWWSTRASALGRVNPMVPIAFGFMAMTTGNPYGAVAVAVVYLAVIAEVIARRSYRRIGSLIWSGSAVLAMSLIVYLPLAFTTDVSVRTQSGVSNTGSMRPGLGDLINVSSPTHLPMVQSFGTQFMTIPLVFLAWFLVPLAPWIRWRTLAGLRKGAISLAVFGGIYAVLLLGPSNLWLFRWPARFIEYGQLPVLVVVAVALSRGLAHDRISLRASLTAALLVLQFYLAWSSIPEDLAIHALALLVCAAATAAAIMAARTRPDAFAAVLVAGIIAVLALQTNAWFRGNDNVTPWRFPRDTAFLENRLDARYQGNTFAIADIEYVPEDAPTSQWGDLLFGNAWQGAGVEAVNSYAGISYADFVNALCLNYYGGVECADAVDRLSGNAPGTDVPWTDALRLETIVLQNSGAYGGPAAFDSLPADQWTVEVSDVVSVARRIEPLPWPDGRLSATDPGLTVTSDSAATDTRETVQYNGSGAATFALLAWPGWTAEVDGEPLDVTATDGGLLQVELPQGGESVTLEYRPPGTGIGLALAGIGVLLALAQSVAHSLKRRSVKRSRSGV
ncbi:MAG: YfhO family protein [Rhodococcus sp. (in: high G+C Gram-positive bacteria)]|uniref:YfhO family protein n=1 Tax=Rhodococcus sp. TaxID=1831 RepID=UPI002AD96F67|nr:YfhO family protein [Rhodococcus sp. (in: high G+C Gram-positive bacteria)]